MIDFGKILKRAWHILWNYKVLWIFGILLAITAGGNGGSGNGGSSGSGYHFDGSNGFNGGTSSTNPTVQQIYQWLQQNIAPAFLHPDHHILTFVWIGVVFLLFILIVSTVFALIRYPSETAVIRMVDEYEQTGNKVGFRAGWKMGWNRRAFRMWLIDFITGVPFFIMVAFLIGLGVIVFFTVRSGNQAIAATGIVASIGCFFLFILAIIVLAVALALLRQFFIRKTVLENTGVGDSFRQGWEMFKRNWKSATLMWLIMLGIGIAFGIASVIIFFLLIPAYIILAIPGAIVAAIPGLVALGITSIFAAGPVAWIVGLIVALPFFFLIAFSPLALVSGLYKIYESSIWTLAFREIKVLDTVAPSSLPPVTLPEKSV